LLTVDTEAKLQKLMTIDRNYHNWSWLLDPNRPHVSPVLPKVPTPGKNQSVAELGFPSSEKSPLPVDLARSRVPGRVVPTKEKRTLAQSS